MIASCDHQHCAHLEAAAKAKKDAYCEKPLAMSMESLVRTCDAVKAAGIVVQMGTQVRSRPPAPAARSSSSRAPSARSPGSNSAATAPTLLVQPAQRTCRGQGAGRRLAGIPPGPARAAVRPQIAHGLVRIPRVQRRPDRQPGLPLHRPVQLHRGHDAADQLRGPGRRVHLEGRVRLHLSRPVPGRVDLSRRVHDGVSEHEYSLHRPDRFPKTCQVFHGSVEIFRRKNRNQILRKRLFVHRNQAITSANDSNTSSRSGAYLSQTAAHDTTSRATHGNRRRSHAVADSGGCRSPVGDNPQK